MDKQTITLKAEQTQIEARAEIATCSPDEQQRIDDDVIIPNVGDNRVVIQQGSIYSPDGETVIKTDLYIKRTRNAKGGVDVLCTVPALSIASEGGL